MHIRDVLQQCQPLNISGVNVLLEGGSLRLQVEDPLQVVTTLQL
jgi:hypothetical protein